jgi:hypothetical protein
VSRRLPGTIALLSCLLFGACAWRCVPGTHRLDEVVFREGPGYRLKVVRYYENLPLHYSGEIYTVQCSSEATRDFEAHSTQDAGWRTLARGGAIGTTRASDVVPRLEGQYRAIDRSRLVWLGTVFQVSFDGCGHFASWDPTSLPPERIDPVPKPDYCAPKGDGDCRLFDFQGERAPRYDDIRVEEDGRVAFRVRTPALRGSGALRVTSSDFGRSWEVAEAPPSDPLGYRLRGSGSHWDRAGEDRVFEDLEPRYRDYFAIVLDPATTEEPNLRPLRDDLEAAPVGRRNFDALNAVAMGYFELSYRAEASRTGVHYLGNSFRAAKIMAVPWRAYGLIEDGDLRSAILDFFEDAGSGEKLLSGVSAPRLAPVVASLRPKESDPVRRARIEALTRRLEALAQEAERGGSHSAQGLRGLERPRPRRVPPR